MARERLLRGRSICVVGAGLAGLAAAFRLRHQQATVTVLDARDRVGGRVLTIREEFAGGQHAEAGADFIDEGQEEICRLVRALGLDLIPILRTGFGLAYSQRDRMVQVSRSSLVWNRLAGVLQPLILDYRWSEERWDGVVAKRLGSLSVADWMKNVHLPRDVSGMLRSLRGFFLADPTDLSLLSLVDQLASGTPGRGRMYRIRGGNDRLPLALAATLGDDVRLRHEVLTLAQTNAGVLLTVRTASGEERVVRAHYAILAVPATKIRSLKFDPALPPSQRSAVTRLRYGPVTKTLLQCDRRFWRGRGRPLAYGTNLPVGAVWDGNEEQKAKAGILCLMAGGSASAEVQEILEKNGPAGLLRRLDWLGDSQAAVLATHTVSWERDPWAGGGYAVFDPGYDPALRQWLARPHGRILFAGEYTSFRWQGYMNGAIESGLRAAAEVEALIRMESPAYRGTI
ncbi:MAG TPA: NAD(P)/FAD-dependent oxidoreductase [Nitrospiraceae bacterium]|nr:NAD(P)/FAD-dependent oxidoreductase [Nitrospiraceae bacterium]